VSNAQTLPVGTVAVPAFPSNYGEALTVANSGSVTLYLGDSTGLQVATGFPLSPGSTIGWDKGRALYAIAAVPAGGQVTLLTNGGQLNDVSALATAIIDAGLASDIASAISVQGVPVIDDPTTLFLVPTTTNIDSAPLSWIVDVTRFQSLTWVVYANTGNTGKFPAFPMLVASVEFFDPNGISLQYSVGYLVARSADTTYNTYTIKTPVIGSQARFVLSMMSGQALGAGGGISTSAIGSYRALTDAQAGSPGITMLDAQAAGYVSGWDANLGSGLSSFWLPSSNTYLPQPGIVVYPPWRNGAYQITMTGQLAKGNTTSVNLSRLVIQDALNSSIRYHVLNFTGTTGTVFTLAEDFTLNVGFRPLAILLQNFTPVAGNEPVITSLFDPF
jgi:hypothetical protein